MVAEKYRYKQLTVFSTMDVTVNNTISEMAFEGLNPCYHLERRLCALESPPAIELLLLLLLQ